LSQLVLAELAAEYSSVQGYAVDRLGEGGEMIGALRARLLERS